MDRGFAELDEHLRPSKHTRGDPNRTTCEKRQPTHVDSAQAFKDTARKTVFCRKVDVAEFTSPVSGLRSYPNELYWGRATNIMLRMWGATTISGIPVCVIRLQRIAHR